ncbi:MAG: T9SS type A sorting domain-containing protein [Flavobacteriales bacterium]|nr:T9SS type A sorting domain-containing protein [Flavobacteriales bacterium]
MKIVVPFLFILTGLQIDAQTIERQLISCSGFSASLPTIEMDCTVGEPQIAFEATSENILSQGFLQPHIDDIIQVKESTSGYLLVYPNPAQDHFTIQSEQIIKGLELFDTSGRMILKSSPHTYIIEIHPECIAQGFYHIKITTTKGVFTKNIQIF